MAKPIVPRIEDGMDRREVLCTTYQMRNMFRQFYDGVAGELDAHCYFQHQAAADLCKAGGTVLDVCCGRGLLIPFLRYTAKPSVYVGVDIHAKNARWKDGADPRREKDTKDWGFPCVFVESNVDCMAKVIQHKNAGAWITTTYDVIVYTSAIEHMQPKSQQKSLKECGKLAHSKTLLYLTCPVTPPGRDGYDAQYRAHVYEPSDAELRKWLTAAGWQVDSVVGLSTKVTHVKQTLKGKKLQVALRLLKQLPRLQALTTIPAVFPETALEVAYVCSRTGTTII